MMPPPAQLTSTSSRSKSCACADTRASMSPSTRRSARCTRIETPARPASWLATFSRRPSSRPLSVTSKPSATSAAASAEPMPPDAPVTSAARSAIVVVHHFSTPPGSAGRLTHRFRLRVAHARQLDIGAPRKPPSQGIAVAVTKEAAGDARNATSSPMSSGSPSRPTGTWLTIPERMVLRHRHHERRRDQPREHGVGGHAPPAELLRGRLGERDDARFARRVGRLAESRHARGDRGDVHHAPPATRRHGRHRGLDAVEGAGQVDTQLLLPVPRRSSARAGRCCSRCPRCSPEHPPAPAPPRRRPRRRRPTLHPRRPPRARRLLHPGHAPRPRWAPPPPAPTIARAAGGSARPGRVAGA